MMLFHFRFFSPCRLLLRNMTTAAEDNQAELTGFLAGHGITFVGPALALFATLGVEKVSDLDTLRQNDIAEGNLPIVQQRKLSAAVVLQKKLAAKQRKHAAGGGLSGCANRCCTGCCASVKRFYSCDESCNFFGACGLCKQCNWVCGP